MIGMILVLVIGISCALVGLVGALTATRAAVSRRLDRRRERSTLTVTTWPDIELGQNYGGWNADAYDAGTGRRDAPEHLVRGNDLPSRWSHWMPPSNGANPR